MSNVIKPTIGRVVLVHRGISNQPEPALISYVWHDRMINVGGFDHNGKPFAITSLQLLQDDEVATGICYAGWMPFQKGQAAQTEALEAKFSSGQRDPSAILSHIPMQRFVTPAEIGQAVAFLLSGQASAITGISLPVDCGWLAGGAWSTYAPLGQKLA